MFENKFENKVILIAALDWGLGHATRCTSIIQDLKQNNQIIIACTETQKQFFESEFPDLQKVSIVAYNIRYSKRLSLSLKLFLQLPKIIRTIRSETKQVDELVKRYKVDVVISDNRFGFHSKLAHCIYVTHQIQLKAGVFSGIASKIHNNIISHFNEIWIPDYKETELALAGDLSRNSKGLKVKYIGPLSRLKKSEQTEIKYDYLCLLSGPEPQRTLIEKYLIEKAINSNKSIVFARGTKDKLEMDPKNCQICIYDSPNASELSQLISQSQTIVCRSGYSTLMDLHLLGKKDLILVPTPGQTEQEYLANYWKEKYYSKIVLQRKLTEFVF